MIQLTNDKFSICFDEQTGSLRTITDKRRNMILADNRSKEPFILELDQNEFTSEYSSFDYEQDQDCVELNWSLKGGIKITAGVRLRELGCAFTVRADNPGTGPVSSLEYPLIDGLQSHKNETSYLAHSYATGFLVEDPLKCFDQEEDGLRYMPYPESFSGSSMQFFTYYTSQSGLYFAAYDGEYHQKWLNCYRKNEGLRASQIAGYEDIAPGKPVEASWDFVVELTEGEGWQEAADRYRQWALEQEWCSKGRLDELDDAEKAGWLVENTGAVTFGINGKHNRSKWIRRYSEDIGTPIFHVTGPDWTNETQDYKGDLPGGYEDWVPTRFSAENLKAFHECGDAFAPFEFDFLLSTVKSDKELIVQNLQKWPENPKSYDAYTFNMLCPITEYTKDLHIKRDVQISKESSFDAIYYDISANNIIKTCMNPDHGHPVGAGQKMTKAYREIYRETKRALCEDRKKYIAMGTEMMNEVFLDCLDYYQARAYAQPCSALETFRYHSLIKQGKAYMIPMFHYVYGGYAPVRMDGWGKLVEEGGDLVYHTIAKTYLWGGLFEINSEYSPMEALDQEENKSEEHYCDFDPRGYEYRPEIASYLSKFAKLRVGTLGKFLAYGTMNRSPVIHCAVVMRTYRHYNISKGAEEYGDEGVIKLDSVLGESYHYQGQNAVILANTTAFPQDITLECKEIQNAKKCTVYHDIFQQGAGQEIPADKLTEISLEPYQLVVVTTI